MGAAGYLLGSDVDFGDEVNRALFLHQLVLLHNTKNVWVYTVEPQPHLIFIRSSPEGGPYRAMESLLHEQTCGVGRLESNWRARRMKRRLIRLRDCFCGWTSSM
jgi:hypothetical protein